MYLDDWKYVSSTDSLWNTQDKGSPSDPSLLSIYKI